MTEFQRRILAAVTAAPNQMLTRWEIAQQAFPEKWRRKRGRAAIIGHIDRAARKLPQLGRIDPRDRWDDATIYLRG